jgi:PadR family transcriptional regulator PadR
MKARTRRRADTDLHQAFIRLHVLHHAAEQPVFGLWMIEELTRHGYHVGPGTLYPIFHGLEARGYLRSNTVRSADGRHRRFYRITAAGRRALAAAKVKLRELAEELFEHD